MITVLRNNRLLAKRRKNKFEQQEEIHYSKDKKFKKFPKASPELLKKIRKKLRKERWILLEKTIIWFSVVAFMILLVLKTVFQWLLVWLAYGVFNPFNSFFYFFLTGSVGYPYAVAISKRITGYGCH